MTLSIVIPLLNEAESLPQLHEWIIKAMEQETYEYEVLYIDDGSTDKSWNIISELAEAHTEVKGISFTRNYGKSQALHAGFSAAQGNYVATLDADLQDSPEEIKNFTPVEQPLVRKNNLTQRKTIFLSSHIGKVKDWIRPDSMCFIDDLIEYATQTKFKYVHKWSNNDLIIWDNRQTMHRARAFDDLKENRDMRRTTVLGEEQLIQ